MKGLMNPFKNDTESVLNLNDVIGIVNSEGFKKPLQNE